MVTAKVAELKKRLSKYLALVKSGEEIVIRDRNLPVAKLVPFSSDGATEEELLLVTAGKCVCRNQASRSQTFSRFGLASSQGVKGFRLFSTSGKKADEPTVWLLGLRRISSLVRTRGDQPPSAITSA